MKPPLKTRYKTFLLPQGISHVVSQFKKNGMHQKPVGSMVIFSVLGQFYLILSKWVLPTAFLITSPIASDPAEIIKKEKRTIHPEILLSQFKISKVLVNTAP